MWLGLFYEAALVINSVQVRIHIEICVTERVKEMTWNVPLAIVARGEKFCHPWVFALESRAHATRLDCQKVGKESSLCSGECFIAVRVIMILLTIWILYLSRKKLHQYHTYSYIDVECYGERSLIVLKRTVYTLYSCIFVCVLVQNKLVVWIKIMFLEFIEVIVGH